MTTKVKEEKKYKNKARCKLCGDVLESKFRHDFVTCSCTSLSLDGGLAYRRVLWKGGEYDEVVDDILEEITPIDVQKTANLSAKERDLEQAYYRALYTKLSEEFKDEDNAIRSQDGDGQR